MRLCPGVPLAAYRLELGTHLVEAPLRGRKGGDVARIDLIDTTEMYLKTIYEMVEDHVVPMRARIVERLGHSGPTVSQTVARMERDGLVTVRGDRQLELTPEGLRLASEVMRKHRLAECLLISVIGLDWVDAHDEACRWEHVMSRQVEDRISVLLKDPETDPYGNPIPPADRADEQVALPAALNPNERSLESASAVASQGTLRLTRIGEPIQAEPVLLKQISAMGLRPGSVVSFESNGELSTIWTEDRASRLSIPPLFAPHLFGTLP